MRLIVLSIITLMFASEAFAQRGPRYNPPGRGHDRHDRNDRYDRHDYRPAPDYRHDRYDHHDYRRGPVVVISSGHGRVVINPRRTYSTGRVYRSYRRTPVIWSVPFGYSCNMYGDLALNGRPIHNFRYSMDCHDAVNDIRIYGDYCDDNVMYDQSGHIHADFASRYECRDALGWYY